MKSFVTIARIVKTRGVRGEVAAVPLTDFPERFGNVRAVRVFRDGVGSLETLQRHWFHKGRVILKFQGVDDPDQASRLVGGEVQVPEEERVSPPPGTYFDSDLIGCVLYQDGRPVGAVREILKVAGSAANLVLETKQGHEAMVPLVGRFILGVDVEAKKIEARLPPGLLELGKPASGKKKRSKSWKTRPAEPPPDEH